MKPRIMYIERKSGQISGPARIGRFTFSRSGQTIDYRGHRFYPALGLKANYCDWETGELYWISGCKKGGGDRLYRGTIEIDEDALEEYWTEIRGLPGIKTSERFAASESMVAKVNRAKVVVGSFFVGTFSNRWPPKSATRILNLRGHPKHRFFLP